MTAKQILDQLTLREKASLTTGSSFWHFSALKRLGLDYTLVTDGPHGIRKQKEVREDAGESEKATCFPPAVLSAASWDESLLEEEGDCIAKEALSLGVSIVLGPGINIKRSPLCGRNFEYFSEDPYLAGKMAAAWIRGVQKNGIGTSLKHFAANNQEKMRLIGNSVVDERALREIYLTGFEIAVKESHPWSIMCAYNMINGTYASDNRWLLNDVLREEWGFDGIVITDWAALNDRVEALKASLDIEMPGPNESSVDNIVKAVEQKHLSEDILDKVVLRIIDVKLRAAENRRKAQYDKREHHETVRKIAGNSIVLLKNEGTLPLDKSKKYLVLGEFAKKPRYQGSGSSQINSHYVDSAYDEFIKRGYEITYSDGYSLSDSQSDEKLKEALRAAKDFDDVIIFAGLTEETESEAFDRTTLSLPEAHDKLIEEVARISRNVTVVLYAGSPFLMPWLERVNSVLLCYLPGDAAGSAALDVLSGLVNPSGKLAETFPLSLEDTPCYGEFATEDRNVFYKESILTGYRYYDYMKKDVLFPFGYGLSYTTFQYEDISVEFDPEKKEGCVSVTLKNTGERDGAETVQIYIEKLESNIFRAVRELKGFKKVFLKAGERKTVSIPLSSRSFSYYSLDKKCYEAEDGAYRIYAAASSRDLRLSSVLCITGSTLTDKWRPGDDFSLLFADGKLPVVSAPEEITLSSSIRQAMQDERASLLIKPMLDSYIGPVEGKKDGLSRMKRAMALDMPIRSLAVMTGNSQNELRKELESLKSLK